MNRQNSSHIKAETQYQLGFRGPDFIIVGGMKCGTSTLAAQLNAQNGIFLTDPKEPNYFSGEDYVKKSGWYRSLFSGASETDIKGEASTNYTKLPTYKDVAARAKLGAPDASIIYIIRDPFERIISHYMHEWTMGEFKHSLDEHMEKNPEIIDYSRYSLQIKPWVEAYGKDKIHLTSLEAMKMNPDRILGAVAEFIGLDSEVAWSKEHHAVNEGTQRFRKLPMHGIVFENPIAETLRRTLVPKAMRDFMKNRRTLSERPKIRIDLVQSLKPQFQEDYRRLCALFPENLDLRLSFQFLED